MRDNPEMEAEEAINRSMQMMNGHKMELFLLSFSFIGWILLPMLTLCVGMIWVLPYMWTAQAAFYEKLKAGEEVSVPAV